jgi:hypothetical protein
MFEFLVDGDPERLKYPRRRMQMRTRRSWRYMFDNFSQVDCCTKWLGRPPPNKSPGETASSRFFTQFTKYTLEFFFTGTIDDIDSTKGLPLVHAHI